MAEEEEKSLGEILASELSDDEKPPAKRQPNVAVVVARSKMEGIRADSQRKLLDAYSAVNDARERNIHSQLRLEKAQEEYDAATPDKLKLLAEAKIDAEIAEAQQRLQQASSRRDNTTVQAGKAAQRLKRFEENPNKPKRKKKRPPAPTQTAVEDPMESFKRRIDNIEETGEPDSYDAYVKKRVEIILQEQAVTSEDQLDGYWKEVIAKMREEALRAKYEGGAT